MTRLALAVILIAALVAPARADDEDVVPPAAWGVATLDVLGGAYVAGRVTGVVGDSIVWNIAPALISGGVAFGAAYGDWDPTPALAAHGAVWAGADLMLLGMLIDGRDEPEGLELGKAAAILGVVGAVGGGVLGATLGDRVPEAWLVAPTGGMIGGAIVGGMWVLVSGDMGGDRSVARFTAGVAGGVAVAIAIAAIAGARTDSPEAAPRVAVERDRVLVSFGGAF